jgi:uncharacterized membrane protein YhiD involved in acid resistance
MAVAMRMPASKPRRAARRAVAWTTTARSAWTGCWVSGGIGMVSSGVGVFASIIIPAISVQRSDSRHKKSLSDEARKHHLLKAAVTEPDRQAMAVMSSAQRSPIQRA